MKSSVDLVPDSLARVLQMFCGCRHMCVFPLPQLYARGVGQDGHYSDILKNVRVSALFVGLVRHGQWHRVLAGGVEAGQFQHDLLLRGLIEFTLSKQSARAIERFPPPTFDLGHGWPRRRRRSASGGNRKSQDFMGIPHQPAPADSAAVSQNSRKSMRLHPSMPNIFMFTSVVLPPR